MKKKLKLQTRNYELKNGFTLVELLVVISIVGVLMAVSIFGLQGARESSRNARRKADLELIRSGLELYRSDCNFYPIGSSLPASLVGDDSTSTCLSSNVYIQGVPDDPTSPARSYIYNSPSGFSYELCASLESDIETIETCGGSSNCGETCNYKAISP